MRLRIDDGAISSGHGIKATLAWAENLVGFCALMIVSFSPLLVSITLYSIGYHERILVRLLMLQAIMLIPDACLLGRGAVLLHRRTPELVPSLASSIVVPMWMRLPAACWWLSHAVAAVFLANFAAEHCLINRPQFADEIIRNWVVAGFLNLGGGYAAVLFLVLGARSAGAGANAIGVLWRLRFVIDLLLAIVATLAIGSARLS